MVRPEVRVMEHLTLVAVEPTAHQVADLEFDVVQSHRRVVHLRAVPARIDGPARS